MYTHIKEHDIKTMRDVYRWVIISINYITIHHLLCLYTGGFLCFHVVFSSAVIYFMGKFHFIISRKTQFNLTPNLFPRKICNNLLSISRKRIYGESPWRKSKWRNAKKKIPHLFFIFLFLQGVSDYKTASDKNAEEKKMQSQEIGKGNQKANTRINQKKIDVVFFMHEQFFRWRRFSGPFFIYFLGRPCATF